METSRVKVDLGLRSYSIYSGCGILNSFKKIATEHKLPNQLAVVTDRNVARLYLKNFAAQLKSCGYDVIEIIIPPGEKNKTLETADKIYTQLLKANYNRDMALIAFGGGVVGDVTGFTAATFRRGIPFIQIPTTLLAQAESSVGGKTAVNHPFAKNAIGAFYQPKFVLSDTLFLASLPKREIIGGLGEIVKYAILDKKIFEVLNKHLSKILHYDLGSMQLIIELCNKYKAKLIEVDEFERNPAGGRILLNLGHTIGHVLENLSNYKLHHGEAVLVGLKWEMEIAWGIKSISEQYYKRIKNLIERVGFKPTLVFINKNDLLKSIFYKKAKFVLPKDFNVVNITEKIEKKHIRSIATKIIK